jgi:hypothetical protein
VLALIEHHIGSGVSRVAPPLATRSGVLIGIQIEGVVGAPHKTSFPSVVSNGNFDTALAMQQCSTAPCVQAQPSKANAND